MKNYLMISACLVVLAANCTFAADEPKTIQPDSAAAAGKTSETAVTVNGAAVTEADIEEELAPILRKAQSQLPPAFIEQYKKQMRQQAIERIIAKKLIEEEIKKAGTVVTDEEAANKLKELAAGQGLTLENLKELLKANNQSYDDAVKNVKEGMVFEKFLLPKIEGKIKITIEDANDFYNKNKTSFEVPEQVRASHILILPDTSDPNIDPNTADAVATAKAEGLLKQIKDDGADFAKLAQENSADTGSAIIGGDLKFFPRGKMVPPFDKAAFALKPGQISDIVKTQYGYHIIKVTDHKDAGVESFDQAKDRIIEMLTQQQKEQFIIEYVESLKTKASIVYPPGKEPAPAPILTPRPQ